MSYYVYRRPSPVTAVSCLPATSAAALAVLARVLAALAVLTRVLALRSAELDQAGRSIGR